MMLWTCVGSRLGTACEGRGRLGWACCAVMGCGGAEFVGGFGCDSVLCVLGFALLPFWMVWVVVVFRFIEGFFCVWGFFEGRWVVCSGFVGGGRLLVLRGCVVCVG
jgi:hypothetical protein